MNPVLLAQALQLLTQGAVMAQAVSAVSETVSKAIEAANNGDDAKATAYLAEARGHFSSASAKWDAAGVAAGKPALDTATGG